MKKMTFAAIAAVTACNVSGQILDTIKIDRMDVAVMPNLMTPAMIDSTDVNGHRYDVASVLSLNRNAHFSNAGCISAGSDLAQGLDNAMGRLSFRVDVKKFIKGVVLNTPTGAHAYINGNAVNGPQNLKPGSYRIDIDWVSSKNNHPKADVSIVVPAGASPYMHISPVSDSGPRMAGLGDFMDGTHASQISLSPNGKYLQIRYTSVAADGKKRDSFSRIFRTSDLEPVCGLSRERRTWMPRTDVLWTTRTADDGTTTLCTVDPLTNHERILVSGIPDGDITVSPSEDYAILTTTIEGPKEDPQVYQITEPEDRQPGWRTRTQLWRIDFATGAVTPVTYGHRLVQLTDISADGKKILVQTQQTRYTKRPTTICDILAIDMGTLHVDTIVSGDGFVNYAIFSPDASKVLVNGTPEAFDGIGRNLPDDRIPSMSEKELFIVNIGDKSVDAITKLFDPSIGLFGWSAADGNIYMTAQDRDREPLFVYNPAKRTFKNLSDGTEEMVRAVSLPQSGSTIAWSGSSVSNSDKVYITDTRKGITRLVDNPSRQRLADVALGQVHPFNYKTTRGDSIYARYYLPADFDPTQKYPVIVNYYGGCSPIGRDFESRYPQHLYAAQGYAVLVINPSGCTGRGQEWSSRHVNTAGKGVAQDIIEGTQQFCRTHQWADSTALGCIGASYGGFMTQYLQTQTDMFAAAISHAGISDHTSYWGEGYWGYSYSEVAMANSYPWTRKDLYVDQSPLYLADRITTPLLFLHGASDHNVPVGESIQMFTALKLLGRPTAFVAVADQDHHILDYEKRVKWQDTIFAWFEKYLKHDSTWWDTLYPPKSL